MRHADVLVLGGGLVGMACARELAKRGASVELLEARTPGAGSSSAGAGLLAPISDWESVQPVVGLCRSARDGWRAWLSEVELESGVEVEYDASGGFLVALDEAESALLAAELAIADAAGEPVHEVTVAVVRGAVPHLAPDAVRALHFPGEHRVDNARACLALAESCRRAGVAIREGFSARRVLADARGVRVVGENDAREGGRLVIAAGAWSGRLEGVPPLPVRPVRGQMLRLEEAAWPWRGSVRGAHHYAVRRGADGLLVGATIEEAGFAERPTLAGIAGLLAFARRLFPGLGDPPLTATWAGLRPGSPDGLPLVGPLGDPKSGALFAACGHYRNGILLAPWTGAAIAGWILDGAPPEPVAAFDPHRFR